MKNHTMRTPSPILKQPIPNLSECRKCVLTLLALGFGTVNALAFTSGTWTLNGNGNWSTSSNWSGGVPDGAGATADLSNVTLSGSNRAVTLDGPRTIGTLVLGASGKNLDLNGSNILTLDGNGGNAQINFRSGGKNGSTGVVIALSSNLLITNPDSSGNTGILISSGLSSSNGNLTITNNSNLASRTKFNSTISDGTGTITFVQTSGYCEFNNANTFTGSTTNSSGSIVLGNSLALQNSALNTSASITGNTTNGLCLINGVSTLTSLTLGGLTGNKDFASIFNTATSGTYRGGYSGLTVLTLNPGTGVTNSYSGVIANGATGMALTKTGAGTQTLSGANTYSGATSVNQGTLALGSGGSITHTSSISIAASATLDVSAADITLTGSSPQQTLACASTSGAAAIAAADRTVTLSDNALLAFQAAGGSSSTIGKIGITGGNLTLHANAVTVNVSGSALAAGIYRLLDCTGTLNNTGTFGTPTIAGTPLATGFTAMINTTTGPAGHLDLVVTAGGYSGWSAGLFPSGKFLTDTNPAHDFDGGGLSTGIEWVTGGDPTNPADDASVTPTLDNTSDATYFIFTYRRTQTANTDTNTTIKVEYGSNLGGWTTAVHDGTNIIITSTLGGGGSGIDLVHVKIKRAFVAGNKLFARLNVAVAIP